MAGHYREAFDLTHVVKLMQSLARTTEHSRRFLAQVAGFAQAQDLENPDAIALLLRQDA